MVGVTDQGALWHPGGSPAWGPGGDVGAQSRPRPAGTASVGWGLHACDFRLAVTGGKYTVCSGARAGETHRRPPVCPWRLHAPAGDCPFGALTGRCFFLVLPLPLPATFQVTNFSA